MNQKEVTPPTWSERFERTVREILEMDTPYVYHVGIEAYAKEKGIDLTK